MNRTLLTAAFLAAGLMMSSLPVAADNFPKLESEAREIVRRFAGELKPELKHAIAEGGPVNAIEVCSKRAPEIAGRLNRETNWTVTRVSLKPRNRETGTPDAWEKEVLESFDRRQSAGESPTDLEHAQVTEGNFRYMKAQGVEPLCLTCHGKTLAPSVQEALQTNYPEDMATGYSPGEIRGAFSLKARLK
ncbi:MAG: DUF3365 domain-containing protein [Pseudomonadales bacterium]